MQEYFERAAAVYIDLPGPSKVLEGGAGKAAYEDAGAAVGCAGGCLKLALQLHAPIWQLQAAHVSFICRMLLLWHPVLSMDSACLLQARTCFAGDFSIRLMLSYCIPSLSADEDMFADEDDKAKEAAAAPAAAAPAAAAPAAVPAAAPAAAPPRAAAPAKQQRVCRTGGVLFCS